MFRSARVVVFVDGDFWHGNAWRLRGLSSLEELFPSRTDWWTKKIRRTMERDAEVTRLLEDDGWLVLRFWESEVLSDTEAVAERVRAAVQRSERGRAA